MGCGKRKRTKKYRPRAVRTPKIVLQHRDFQQVDDLLGMIEREEVWEAQGNVVMRSPEGELYQVAPALEAWCDYWLDVASKHGQKLDDSALRTLVNKINCNIALTPSVIHEAKYVVEQQRKLFMNTGRNTISTMAIKHKIYLEDTKQAAA